MNKHGGFRKGAGKKPVYKKPMKRKEVMLDEETINFYLVIGNGNLSKGIRDYWRGVNTAAAKKTVTDSAIFWNQNVL